MITSSNCTDTDQGVKLSKIKTNEIKKGSKIIMNNEPCSVIENNMHKPGKGQATNRIKYRVLTTGKVLEKVFKSGDALEQADVIETEHQFLYADGDGAHFMDPVSYEQIQINLEALGETKYWLKDGLSYSITFHDDTPIDITAPNFVELEVTKSDPGVKGDTASNTNKPATLETGLEIQVPLFVQEGDILKIDTRDSTYVERVK
jgi:elongation factor P